MGNPNPSPETRIGQPRGPKPGAGAGLTKEAAAARDRARNIAAKAAPHAVKRVAKIAKMGGAQREGVAVELAANKELLDRGLGKPAQEISLEIIEKERAEMQQVLMAVVNAVEGCATCKAAINAALEPFLGSVQPGG